MKTLRRLRYWRGAAERERQLREEMEAHRDLVAQELESAGMPPRKAREEATRRFGSTLHHAEEARDAWITRTLASLVADLRYAVRLMRWSPGVTAAAVVSAALGIGVCTAIFATGSALLERTLPVARPDRLIAISGRSLKSGNIGQAVSAPEWRALNESAASMHGVAAYLPLMQGIFGGKGEPVRYWGSITSANYFDVVRPGFAAGGGFSPNDDEKGRPPVAVISHALWQTRFSGDRSIVGRGVEMNGRSVMIAGVVAPGFRGTDPASYSDFWIPLSMGHSMPQIPPSALEEFDSNWLYLLGRLRDGVTVQGAVKELDGIAARLRRDFAGKMSQRTYHVEPAGLLFPAVRGFVERIYLLLLGTSLLVLLIACANIANLLLARATARRREIATRLAIGVGRGRLIRQLLTESLTLAAMGGVAGVLLCQAALPLIASLDLPMPLPLDLRIGLSPRALGFAALATTLTGLVFGLAPAWNASRRGCADALKGGEPFAGHRWSFRDALVVAQVTAAVVLLVGAGLLVRSLQSAARIDTGVGARNLLLTAVDPTLRQYTPQRTNQFLDELSRRVALLPGVESVSTTSRLPLGLLGIGVGAKDARRKDPGAGATANYFAVSPGFFETLRVPVVQGEAFEARHERGEPVAMLNRAAARKLFGDDDPVGLMLGSLDKPYRVIGVAADFAGATVGAPPNPAIFVLRSQVKSSPALFGTYLVARTAGEPLPYLDAVRAEIRRLDPDMAILETKTWAQHHAQALLVPRLAAQVVAFCGAMGFLIAAVGLYGVIRYSVERRTRELGIRQALGARRADIEAMVVKQGAWLAAAGLALGLGLSLAAGRAIQGLLFGVAGSDPLTYAVVAPLVLGIALAAAWLPARRAARVSPVEAIRCD